MPLFTVMKTIALISDYVRGDRKYKLPSLMGDPFQILQHYT